MPKLTYYYTSKTKKKPKILMEKLFVEYPTPYCKDKYRSTFCIRINFF